MKTALLSRRGHPSWPNLFLVGAAKSGTTALYRAVARHEDVFFPEVKEPHFFAYLADPTGLGHLYRSRRQAGRSYTTLYRAAARTPVRGDASTTNLVVPGAAAAIAREVPAARVVAVLRHPVDRALSHYRHFVAAGAETLSFAEATSREDARVAGGLPFTYRYLGWSRYAGQLQPFFEHFGRDRLLVHLYDDFCDRPEETVRSIWRFAGVDPEVDAVVTRENQVANASSAAPVLDPELRSELTLRFCPEIDQLERLLGRTLDGWR